MACMVFAGFDLFEPSGLAPGVFAVFPNCRGSVQHEASTCALANW